MCRAVEVAVSGLDERDIWMAPVSLAKDRKRGEDPVCRHPKDRSAPLSIRLVRSGAERCNTVEISVAGERKARVWAGAICPIEGGDCGEIPV
jgi:hypothetical protein